MIENRVNLVIEYIEQILNDNVDGKIGIYKIEGEPVEGMSIIVPTNNFERYFNIGIPFVDEEKLFRCLMNTLIERYLKSETFGISKYRNVISIVGPNFHGIYVSNTKGNHIDLSFRPSDELVTSYNSIIDEYARDQNVSIRSL